jgi:methyl-accepting chemotaxis protein
MVFLSTLKIKTKLYLLLLIPLVGLLYFAGITVKEKAHIMLEIKHLEELVSLSTQAAEVIQQFQQERNKSETFLQTQNDSSAKELEQQWQTTNAAIDQLKQALIAWQTNHLQKSMRDTYLTNSINKIWLKHFQQTQLLTQLITNYLLQLQKIQLPLQKIRSQVKQLQLTETKVVASYTQINQTLFSLIKELATFSTHQEVHSLELAYIIFLSSKELAELERSLIFNALRRQQFVPGEFQHFIELTTQQRLYRRIVFQLLATPQQLIFFEQQATQADFLEVQKIRDKIAALGETGKLSEIEPTYWLKIQTGKIQLLKNVETQVASDLFAKAKAIYIQTASDFFTTLFAVLALILLTITLSYLILREMMSSLAQAVKVANAIATGNFANEIKIHTQDEMAELLRAFNTMQTQLRKLLAEEKRITTEALRINQALNSVTTSILISDNDHKIIYLNESAKQLFQQQEHLLRRELPHFEAHRVLGTSMDIFHKQPQHQHRVLNFLQTTHRARITVANLAIDSIITPVINAQQERLGTVVELRDRTQEVATQQEIHQVIQAVAEGNLQQSINLEGKTEFFHTVSDSLNKIIELNQSILAEIMRTFAALAQGDLTVLIERNYAGAFEQLKTDANTTVSRLTTIMKSIKHTAEIVSTTAANLSKDNIILKNRTDKQATSLQEIATNMEQMTSTVRKNAENAKRAHELAATAKHQAIQGGTVVGTTIRAMNAISQSSHQVAEIVNLINSIAFQTNLLALNAAVEAARAGNQGRGFAVVAAEVRNLAHQSASAAKKIRELIDDSVAKVKEGMKLADNSGRTLGEIVNAITTVNDMVTAIANASQQQAQGIQHVNQAIAQMDGMTQQNALLVEETATASKIMSQEAQNLKQQVAFFQLENSNS